jgi:glycosyltransferase involved in cell wall biosynthesis
LYVVGAHATAAIQSEIEGIAGPDAVRFLGQVPDIREPLASYAVFVCPILTGAGMRVKILEAFASGIPVVSTPLGAEGLHAGHGTELLLAASPTEFAEACAYLLDNPDACARMAGAARVLVENEYDWPAAALKLEALYRDLLAKKNPDLLTADVVPVLAIPRSG